MPQPVNLDLVGRPELVEMLRIAIEAGALNGDFADVARARLRIAQAREDIARQAWRDAVQREANARRVADELQDQTFRKDEFVEAANELRAASDLARTLHRQLSRAERSSQLAKFDYEAALADRAEDCAADHLSERSAA